jgi:hypothetical protein
MNKIRLILIFIFLISLNNVYAQVFDFAFNLGSWGWGMNFPRDSNGGHMTFELSTLYIEHINSGVGIKLSPFNSWHNISNSNYLITPINIGLFYNIIGFDPRDRVGSNFLFAGPFISLNYSFHPNVMQVNIGIRAFGMINYREFWRTFIPPIGFKVINLELGYRFNKRTSNNHHFYFNIATDIIVLGAIIAQIIYSAARSQQTSTQF